MSRPRSAGRAGRPAIRHALRALVTLALLVAIAALGQIPFGQPSEQAALRLSLRTVGGKVEVCRDRTQEELAALPQHMRTPRECAERPIEFRLTVAVDGRRLLEETIAPGGLRGDRPVIADRMLSLQPGRVALEIDFSPLRSDQLSVAEGDAFDLLRPYRLEREVELRAGRILLVTLDDQNGRLVTHGDA